MKELVCDMCGSNNIIKQDGLFVCQACNTKYSIEEARKMMAGETVEVEGTVKIDSSDDLENLYELARRSRKNNDYEYALKYYEKILIKDPNNWEAQLYVIYFRAKNGGLPEISIAANTLKDSIFSIIELVKNNVDVDKQEDVLLEIYEICNNMANLLYDSAKNWYFNTKMSKSNSKKYDNYRTPIPFIMYNLGDGLVDMFEGEYTGIATRSWIEGVNLHKQCFYSFDDLKKNKSIIEDYSAKIQKYQPDFETPHVNAGGCYVATSVYGSYNCPEVWTLRRFRDNTLDKNVFGRLFIKTYYLTSPTLVKHFGDKKAFNFIFKPILDKFVKKLNDKGVKSTYYADK